MMSENVIHIDDLSFGYNAQELVIQNLKLNVNQGSIYGFLGANGAGKTTTLKLILGLLKSTTGDINVFGNNTKTNYPAYLKKIGSLIETPSFYAHLSAKDNLAIWSNYYHADKKRIPEVLDILDLSMAANKKTEHFSTGMKQRLGLAAALLHDPELLILDEPTNGLDPMGILELRKVLARLNDEGKTIILSSHILSEVEKIVSHLGILQNGSLVFEGTIGVLHSKRNKNIEISIEVDNTQRAINLIKSTHAAVIHNNRLVAKLNDKNQIPILIKTLTDNDINIYELTQISKDLESMFLSISKESQS